MTRRFYAPPTGFADSFFSVAGDGDNTVFVIDNNLAPGANATYQAAVEYYLESIEGLAQNGDLASYNSALATLAASYRYGAGSWLEAGTSGYDTPVPLIPPTYGEEDSDAAWQTFVTAVYDIAVANYSANVATQVALLEAAYDTWYDSYIVAYDAFAAALDSYNTDYDAGSAAYATTLAAYTAARTAAIAQQTANPYIVNNQPSASPGN